MLEHGRRSVRGSTYLKQTHASNVERVDRGDNDPETPRRTHRTNHWERFDMLLTRSRVEEQSSTMRREGVHSTFGES